MNAAPPLRDSGEAVLLWSLPVDGTAFARQRFGGRGAVLFSKRLTILKAKPSLSQEM
jgi:hypothetical protein